jgi:hypothetical protein
VCTGLNYRKFRFQNLIKNKAQEGRLRGKEKVNNGNKASMRRMNEENPTRYGYF